MICDLKDFYEDEKQRNETRIRDEKARAERKFTLAVEEYEDRITELNNNHEDNLANILDEKNALEAQYMGS